MAVQRRHAQTVRDGASSHKLDYVTQTEDILNIKGHQHCIIALVQKLRQFD